jgi:tryptophan halogenase
MDKFNTLARIELEEIRDFLVLHYAATARDDTPFWRHCQAIDKPDTLRQRWEMYEQTGNIIIEAGILFREASWFAVLHGQGVRAKSYHPFADIPSKEELARRFAVMTDAVRQRVATFPMHDEYIRMNCAAPPMMEKVT